MKKMLIIIGTVLLVLGFNYAASAWVYVPDQGDTGWQTYSYTVGSAGFAGTAGFVVSNVIDNYAYSELLLDNLSLGGGGTNKGFELGNLTGYNLVGTSFATVSTNETAINYNVYNPTQGDFLAVIQGLYNGVTTSQFSNATGQAGTVGSILETALILTPGTTFSFDWAFLGSDFSPWNDFALFYMKDQSGNIVFLDGLAQIGSAPAVPLPSTLLLLGSGLCGLLGLGRRVKRQVG
ncbi:MAG: PEP-CTERM sorting domain-containing protein [Deltaproteobacteria bacterium]|nr:PEP-CTERM sorting domain-containing protein [Deltaproteobacteria bacterium]